MPRANISTGRPRLRCKLLLAGLALASVAIAADAGAAAGSALPENTSPPTISGKPQPGLTVKASPGSWTNEPTRYSYHWELCDPSGQSCVLDAYGAGHFISKDELGHTLRVTVSAVNAAGEGTPVTSQASGLVEGPPVHKYLGRSTHRFALRGSNGYRIKVHSYVNNLYHRITLQAEKDGAFARYNVQGLAKNGVIKARFPGLGAINVHFTREQVKALPPRPGCDQPKELIERGTFVGTIRFHGERGFTTIDTTSAHGSIAKQPGQICAAPRRATLAKRGRVFEYIVLTTKKGPVKFRASHLAGQEASEFSVRAQESLPGMTVVREVKPVSSRADFIFNSELSKAVVSPPMPFEGRATYAKSSYLNEESPGSATEGVLSGTLRVSVPGLGVVPLAAHSDAIFFRDVGVADRTHH